MPTFPPRTLRPVARLRLGAHRAPGRLREDLTIRAVTQMLPTSTRTANGSAMIRDGMMLTIMWITRTSMDDSQAALDRATSGISLEAARAGFGSADSTSA